MLDIEADASAYARIEKSVGGYLGDFCGYVSMNPEEYGFNYLASKAPSVPEEMISWDQLPELKIRSAGSNI